MKVKIVEDYGYAGTETEYEEEIPEEVVAEGDSAIDEWIDSQYDGIWDEMCGKLSLSIKIVEEE